MGLPSARSLNMARAHVQPANFAQMTQVEGMRQDTPTPKAPPCTVSEGWEVGSSEALEEATAQRRAAPLQLPSTQDRALAPRPQAPEVRVWGAARPVSRLGSSLSPTR